jgi:2-phosphosulfolactate phosphatase
MKIGILEFAEGAKKARGITVIIDVFRAFSSACYAFDSGAVRVIATGDVDEAFRLSKVYCNSILAGERNEKKIEGFDLGNSPTEIMKCNLQGKTMILTTTAGTNGLMLAKDAGTIITGSLVNAGAVARYIKAQNPDVVSLVAMGYRAHLRADEDILCAQIIKSEIEGIHDSFEKRIGMLKDGSGKRFFNPDNLDFSPPTDFFLCTMLNRFSFVLKGEIRADGNIDLMKIEY